MEFLSHALRSLREYKSLASDLKTSRLPLAVNGLAGVHKANLIVTLCFERNKNALVIVPDETQAQSLCNDIRSMGAECVFYPVRDFIFRDVSGISREYEHQRINALYKVLSSNTPVIIVACIDAACQYTIPKEFLKKASFTLESGKSIKIENLLSVLIMNGYTRCDKVEGPGQFACRGGIVDIFMPNSQAPVRVEFWGDEIDTVNYFDTETQRRTDYVESITLTPSLEIICPDNAYLAEKIEKKALSLRSKNSAKAKEIMLSQAQQLREGVSSSYMDKYISLLYGKCDTLFDYMKESLIFISESTRVKERMKAYSWRMQEDIKEYLSDGTLCPGLDTFNISYDDAIEIIKAEKTLYLDNFTHGSFDTPLASITSFNVKQLSKWSGSVKLLREDLDSYSNTNKCIVILAGTQKAAQGLADELCTLGYNARLYTEKSESEQGIKSGFESSGLSLCGMARGVIYVTTGTLSSGLEYPSAGLVVITHGAINAQGRKKKIVSSKKGKQIFSLSELSVGDFVVHAAHGIGIYQGIHKIETQGITKDYIKISYAKGDVLYVPVTQLDLVSKYVGPKEDKSVKINRLGSSEWQKSKARVRKAVKEMAHELTLLYAKRMQAQGFAFSEDNDWQRDFEGRFEYEETDDQLRCIEEIKHDMQRSAPMDRLLCGDVGFGKTEVALRAAFKCVLDSKQCAILVPTTILAWQHYQTILRRFEGFPVRIALLSRFVPPAQQKKTIEELALGRVDIVVGTHRLLQDDIKLRDLGLLIIDEEQRFGVAQKEKIKQIKNNVDILTLSATPIPRTLNMAMSGIRDMSVIEEAPTDRHPVQTYVLEYDKVIIGEAIRKELRRGGQVLFLHNSLDTIEQRAFQLSQQIPEAKIAIAHGRMSEDELSDVWAKMVEQDINLLVCTTIIETGVDLPNANTLIIENADCLGLSQLHQLRGRVGRSSRRAYAYFTFYKNKVLSDIADKRLSAIREFTEFGSGFKIAMRDLELRGAGNLLGTSQHGNMEDVGYDMYLKLLDEAMRQERGEAPEKEENDCLIDLQIQAHIPESYIESSSQRIDIYRRIADIRTKDDANDVTDELIDRFGEPPKAVLGLVKIATIRNLASAMGIYEIKQIGSSLTLYVNDIKSESVGKILRANGKRAFFISGNKPYITIKLNPGEDSLRLLENFL